MFILNKKKLLGSVLVYTVSVSSLFAITDPKSLDIVAVVEGNIDIQLNKDRLEATIRAPTPKSYSSIGNVTATLENTFSKAALLIITDKAGTKQQVSTDGSFTAVMNGAPTKQLPLLVTANRDEAGKHLPNERTIPRNGTLVSKKHRRLIKDYKVVVGVFACYSPDFNAIPGKYESDICFMWESID